MAPQEAETETLKYRTWALKVAIHCDGCRRKVKKVIQRIDGVYTTNVDPQQDKLTVTGNVDADLLIRKLAKLGKHAELWPEKPKRQPHKNNKTDGNDEKDTKGKQGNEKEKGSNKDQTQKEEEGKPEVEDGQKGNKEEEEKKKKKKKGEEEGGKEATESHVLGDVERQVYRHFPVYVTQPPPYVVNYSVAQPVAAGYGCCVPPAVPVPVPRPAGFYEVYGGETGAEDCVVM